MSMEIVGVYDVRYDSGLSQFASFATKAEAELFALKYLRRVPHRMNVLMFRVDKRAPVC